MISFRFIGACLKTQWQQSGGGSWATGGKKTLTRCRNTSAKVTLPKKIHLFSNDTSEFKCFPPLSHANMFFCFRKSVNIFFGLIQQ